MSAATVTAYSGLHKDFKEQAKKWPMAGTLFFLADVDISSNSNQRAFSAHVWLRLNFYIDPLDLVDVCDDRYPRLTYRWTDVHLRTTDRQILIDSSLQSFSF